MGNIGKPEEVIQVPAPIKAPIFPMKTPVPATPVTVPERELVPIKVR